MSFSPTEVNQLKTLIQREGGPEQFAAEVLDLWADNKRQGAYTALAGITATVADWTPLRAGWQTPKPYHVAVQDILADLDTSITAGNAANLGAQLAALAVAVKGYLG